MSRLVPINSKRHVDGARQSRHVTPPRHLELLPAKGGEKIRKKTNKKQHNRDPKPTTATKQAKTLKTWVTAIDNAYNGMRTARTVENINKTKYAPKTVDKTIPNF